MTDLPAIRALPRGPILITTASSTAAAAIARGAAFLRRTVGLGVRGAAGGAGVGGGGGDGHPAFLLLAGGSTVGVALDALEFLFDLLSLEGVELSVAGGVELEEAVRRRVSISRSVSVGIIRTWNA